MIAPSETQEVPEPRSLRNIAYFSDKAKTQLLMVKRVFQPFVTVYLIG
ncbi:hypothetical protein LQZ18_05395 [Lachnospiraceae bacterium ZAX-1]